MTHNRTEFLFKTVAEEAGFEVRPPVPIRVIDPVKDKRGNLTKTVTLPDYYVVEPATGAGAHVELTNGRGDNPHKAAQRRVVQQAGISNYVMLTGYDVEQINNLPSSGEKRSLLIQFLGFILLI